MGKKKFTLLIVDDNNFFIDRIVCLLNETKMIGDLKVANSYSEAVTSLKGKTPDIVLLDINIPGKNGIELLREIREAALECVTIVMSNHDSEYYRDQCKKLGADHFLDKSSDFGMLPSIIKALDTYSSTL
jgi:DNA-binding NarL/FixJ family response regulator